MNFEEALVKEVRKHPVLYNISLPDYKNVMVKDTIWKEISMRLDFPDEICKKRWKNLRDTFRKVKQRIADTRSGSVKPKHWKYFDLLTFLDDIPTTRYTIGNLDILEFVTCPVSPTNSAPPQVVGSQKTTAHVDSRESTPQASSRGSAPQASPRGSTPQISSRGSTVQISSRGSTPQMSSRASTPQGLPRAKKIRSEPSIQDKFNHLLDMVSQKIKEERSTVEIPKTSTELLFQFLTKRIESANLSQRQVSQIENAVFQTVSEKLDEFSDIDCP